METRKETLNALKLCRFCLTQDETLTTLYDRRRAPKNSVPLPLKILSCVSIEVYPSDKMPSFICSRCKFFMEMSYEFKQLCRQADENVLEFVQTGTDLSSVPWPPSLLRLFRTAVKSSPELPIMKTVVEGGATIQVTAQEYDSEEDDDENVYNIKIGDGSDEGANSARVKVITADKAAKAKVKPSKDSEDEDIPSQSAVDENAPTQSVEISEEETEAKNKETCSSEKRDGCWACDECDCTYPLQQLLELHKKVKHRQRNVQCNQCDAKFYNNNDLVVHQIRHSSEELIFQCVACDKKFKRHILLKRHERVMHADLPQLPCALCPATFLSQEALEAHKEKHVLTKEKRYACNVCDKRFHEKSTLQRHTTNVHNKEDTLACVYCPERFPTVSKLTRHVRTHAGERAYPCKHCDKSFMKSHHYTRHLRLKHREINRSVRGPFGQPNDNYRCEQCDDSFATQDELIYHSAIHATQNLTCPLCQEKFEDVDAVTTHIKSHVNGTEFMCDLCELVFTTKDKLDNHVLCAHIDEIQNEELDQEESSNEMEVDDDEDDNGINVKEEDGHMVVEIKKPDEFILPNLQDDVELEEKVDNTNSEESEPELYTELSGEDSINVINKEPIKVVPEKTVVERPRGAVITKIAPIPTKTPSKNDQTTVILKRVDELKREPEPTPEKKIKAESNNTGANDKSLRLLEKELQELKRTNTRTEVVRTATKPVDTPRNKRIQIHTSTPKIRPAVEEKKIAVSTKSPLLEKQKQLEKRVVTKENKEPKEIKDTKGSNGSVKEDKEKEVKGKETPKIPTSQLKSDKTTPDEGIRRSTRPSKIKDYAKMIRDKSQDTDEDEESDEVDEEYKEADKTIENKPKQRRASVKPSPKPTPPPVTPNASVRKRGRPRKDAQPTPAKVKKEDSDSDEPKLEVNRKQTEVNKKTEDTTPTDQTKINATNSSNNGTPDKKKATIEGDSSGVLVSPTGQTLKKIPVQALPPGLLPPGKTLPLPNNARLIGAGKPCKMQLGKKLVNVQKIVVTKAEVEAMTKKGLLQMKDGTMVLKHGVKLPTADSKIIQGGNDSLKESPKKPKAAPTRCDIDEDI